MFHRFSCLSLLLYDFGASIAVDAPGQVLGPGQGVYNQLSGWFQFPRETDIFGTFAIGLGFIFTILLGLLRLKFIWWPLHPVGYAMGNQRRYNGSLLVRLNSMWNH